MANVIVGEKKVGRPIRFEHWRFEPIFRELVFVAIDQIGMRLQKPHNLKKRIRLKHVVVVKKSDPFPAREIESPIRRSRNAFMFSESCQYDSPVAPGKIRQHPEQIEVRRSIINK